VVLADSHRAQHRDADQPVHCGLTAAEQLPHLVHRHGVARHRDAVGRHVGLQLDAGRDARDPRMRGTAFAWWDTWLFVPLCLLIAPGCLVVALSER
jgi:hypothetical protein